jgi:hypothetical protein
MEMCDCDSIVRSENSTAAIFVTRQMQSFHGITSPKTDTQSASGRLLTTALVILSPASELTSPASYAGVQAIPDDAATMISSESTLSKGALNVPVFLPTEERIEDFAHHIDHDECLPMLTQGTNREYFSNNCELEHSYTAFSNSCSPGEFVPASFKNVTILHSTLSFLWYLAFRAANAMRFSRGAFGTNFNTRLKSSAAALIVLLLTSYGISFFEALLVNLFGSRDARWILFLFASVILSAAFALSSALLKFGFITCFNILRLRNKTIVSKYRATRSNVANKYLGDAGQIIMFSFLWLCCPSFVIAQTCLVNSNPVSPCTGVFQIGSSQVPMLYMTEGSSAWVAVKYTTDTASSIVVNTWNASSRNYYVSPSILQSCIANATDILMLESASSVYANMSNAAAFLKVRDNIQMGCSWFKDTHNQNTLVGWMSPYATAKQIPDPRMNNCNNYQCLNSLQVFDSCNNTDGSHAHLHLHWRLRSGGLSTPRIHSIWFRIPLSLLSSANMPPLSLPVTNGLIAMYTADSWRPAESVSTATWMDISGSGNHVTEVGGTTNISVVRPVGAPAYVQGAKTASMKFPVGILPAQYTLFYVARYNGPARFRLFKGLDSEFLAGPTLAYRPPCPEITPTPRAAVHYDWVLGSDRSDSFRSNGVDRTNNKNNGCQQFDRLAINAGLKSHEGSDFAIQSLLVYNAKLSDADVQRVEAWLNLFQPAFTPANLQERMRHESPRYVFIQMPACCSNSILIESRIRYLC